MPTITEPPRWDVIYALPNLHIPSRGPEHDDPPDLGSPDLYAAGLTLGTADVAVVPASDARVQAAAAASAGVRALVNGFYDERGKPVPPAVLVVRRGARVVERADALTAFRNALALPAILHARTAAISNDGYALGPVWSDLFDFFPATVTRDDRLVLRSAAVTGLFAEEVALHATSAPHVFWSRSRMLRADAFLLRALGAEWRRRYRRGARRGPRGACRSDADSPVYGRALFRSLELAYAAAAVPTRNAGSLSDYGTLVALWVSALEVLAWPARQHADRAAVRTLVRAMPWPHDARWVRRRRYTVRDERTKKRIRVTPTERLLALVYDARNAFLHGNPVTARTMLPWGARRARAGATIPAAAALLYRVALTAYLAQRYAQGPDVDDPNWIIEYLDAAACARGVYTLLRGGDDDPDDETDLDAADDAGEEELGGEAVEGGPPDPAYPRGGSGPQDRTHGATMS